MQSVALYLNSYLDYHHFSTKILNQVIHACHGSPGHLQTIASDTFLIK